MKLTVRLAAVNNKIRMIEDEIDSVSPTAQKDRFDSLMAQHGALGIEQEGLEYAIQEIRDEIRVLQDKL